MGSLVVSGAPGAPFASAISLEKADHLLWLGRYAERAYTTQKFILSAYDQALDGQGDGWKESLEELGFDDEAETPRATSSSAGSRSRGSTSTRASRTSSAACAKKCTASRRA